MQYKRDPLKGEVTRGDGYSISRNEGQMEPSKSNRIETDELTRYMKSRGLVLEASRELAREYAL